MIMRYALMLGASVAAMVVGVVTLVYGWSVDERRFLAAGCTLTIGGWVTGLLLWFVGRVDCLVKAYRLGYRTGRNDANSKLLEDGFWLSDRAEADARRVLDDDEGNLI